MNFGKDMNFQSVSGGFLEEGSLEQGLGRWRGLEWVKMNRSWCSGEPASADPEVGRREAHVARDRWAEWPCLS